VERGLCRAQLSSGRRALRGKPKSHAVAHPVPGHHEAEPANAQELYLGSLEAIGIDRNKHDIRFVEDNWESPALGAWGLGWEVWLDGLEITQYTYFQQAGGYPLDPVPVEYTYGLNASSCTSRTSGRWQIDWDGNAPTAISCNARDRALHYNFEVADVNRLKLMYDLSRPRRRTLAHRLVIPAHDYVLRCSHTFNLLDARGAIGVTERAAYFARMRDLARQVSEAYVEQRQHEEFPWLEESVGAGEQGREGAGEQFSEASTDLPIPDSPFPFLLEIGTEELPAGDLVDAISQLKAGAPKLLDDLRLEHGAAFVSGTPRRLAVLVEALAPAGGRGIVGEGPPADRAFDAGARPPPVGLRVRTACPSMRWRCERKPGVVTFTLSSGAAAPRPRCYLRRCPLVGSALREDDALEPSGVAFSGPSVGSCPCWATGSSRFSTGQGRADLSGSGPPVRPSFRWPMPGLTCP
jgi:glycyl-tRNA synthetase